MNLDDAIRLTEILLGIAFVQQSIEHFNTPHIRYLFITRLLLAIALIIGIYTVGVSLTLLLTSVILLHHFQGAYNGGADRMGLLILVCLCLTHTLPSTYWREVAFGYLALQLVLSYFISGWVKIINPDWRNGQALWDVFRFSAYPVSESLRGWVNWPKLLLVMSWCVISFELLFPLALLTQTSLIIALVIAAIFHLSNAFIFGLNRFFWIWITAYPSLLWLQQRI